MKMNEPTHRLVCASRGIYVAVTLMSPNTLSVHFEKIGNRTLKLFGHYYSAAAFNFRLLGFKKLYKIERIWTVVFCKSY